MQRTLSVKDQLGTNPYNSESHGELPTELDLPVYEKHNLGFVPFIEILNKPSRNIMLSMSNDYDRLADDYAVRHMPLHINNGLRQMLKEEILAKSKLAGHIDIQEIKKRGSVEDFITADAMIETKPMGNGGNQTQTMPSTYDGMK